MLARRSILAAFTVAFTALIVQAHGGRGEVDHRFRCSFCEKCT